MSRVVEILLIATGAITVLIAVVAVLLPAGKRAIAAAHASTGVNTPDDLVRGQSQG